jgi:arylsulfatase B
MANCVYNLFQIDALVLLVSLSFGTFQCISGQPTRCYGDGNNRACTYLDYSSIVTSRLNSEFPNLVELNITQDKYGIASPGIAKSASPDTASKTSTVLPHILMVVLDDVGWANLKGFNDGANGKDQYPHTPHFDNSRLNGITLKNLYVQPMCSPTRAAVLTGRYPHRYGSQTFVQRPFQPHFLKEDETTLADKMVKNGYATALVGKWHLGYGLKKYTPSSRGFQRFFGSYEVGGDHFNHTVGPNTHALGQLFTIAEGYQQTLDLHEETSIDGGKTMATHKYVTNRRGEYSSKMWGIEAIKEIDRAATLTPSQPLFLYLAFTTIHTPLQVEEKYIELNKHLHGSDEVRINAAMMTSMDEAYGNVVNALKRNRMWKNTFVIVFSDNGGMISQGASNHPLRGLKMGPFEGGIRSVAMISGGHPQVLKYSGTIANTMMHAVDIHTLLLHFAHGDSSHARPGLPSKKLDAVNGAALWQSITNDAVANDNKMNSSPRKNFIVLLDPLGNYPIQLKLANYVLLGKCSAIRYGKWKLIVGKPGRDDWYGVDPEKCFKRLAHEGTVLDPPFENENCVRGDFRYELIGKKQGFIPKDTWLFDIENDPMEENDLSKTYPDIVKRLKAKLDFEHSEAVDPLPDRWASIMSMMKGNYAVPSPGGGYEAALGHWMEPEHIKNVNFFRKAYAWIRLTSLDIGSKILFPQAQVHKNPTSAGNHYNDNNEYTDTISKEEQVEISNALRAAFGLNKAQRIEQQHLEAIKYKLKLLEKHYGSNLEYGGNRNEDGIKMPRSKM